ncbi:MAG: peptidylprolyl isomerase [Candidatus Zixiibacteriota bacterium]|nr:MAG: peptidylprolyl isomerase [candidate division Zixibacteria bacterium]
MNDKLLCRFLLTILLIALAVGGCGKSGDRTIATVGDYKITADEFNEFFNQIRMTFATGEEEYNKRREILDSMIVTRLLIQGAYELNIDKLEDLAHTVAANRDRFLISALYQKHIADEAQPTDAEMQDFYNNLEYRIRVSHIVVRDQDTAQALFERVKNGENFEQLAFEYSIDPDAKRNKGDLGYLLWGATVDEFQQAAFSMQPGEVSPPVKSRYGHHIIKVVDKQLNETRSDFESMKESLKNQLLRRKAMILLEEYFDLLKAKYPIAIDTATCQYILHKREQLYPPQLLATLPRNDFDIDALDRNEKELVLATWGTGQISLVEYLTQLKNLPPDLRPEFDNYDSLVTIVFEMKKTQFLTGEALAEGMDQDENYIRSMKMFKEFNMADIMKNDSIQGAPPPDDAALRTFYEENIADYTTPPKIHVHEILLSDELTAQKLAKEIKSFNTFKERAAQLTERPGKRSRWGDLGVIEERWYPEIFEAAEKVGVGQIGGPVMTMGKYSIFYVVEKVEPEIKDFLDVKRKISDRVIFEQKNQAIQTWIDERLKATEVDVDEDALWSTIDMDRYAAVDTTTGG